MSNLPPEKYFALSEPCRDCPFRSDIDFPLSRERRDDIAESVTRGEQFVCHKTVDYTAEDSRRQDHATACAGSREVARRSGVVSQLEQIAERLGIPVKEVNQSARVYDSLEEWVEHGS